MVDIKMSKPMAGNKDSPIDLVDFDSDTSLVAVEQEKHEGSTLVDGTEMNMHEYMTRRCEEIIIELGIQNVNHFLSNSDDKSLCTDEGRASKVSTLEDVENDTLSETSAASLNPLDDYSEVDAYSYDDILSSVGEEQIETIQTELGLFLVGISVTDDQPELKKASSYDTAETAASSGVSSSDSVTETTRQMLQVAGKRLEYQQRSEEIMKLKLEIDAVRDQADIMRLEADTMAEKLQQSNDNNRELVDAQEELESFHEEETETLKAYIRVLESNLKNRNILLQEKQAEHDLMFMNEINSLIESHKLQMAEKDFEINQLKLQITSLKSQSVGSDDYTQFPVVLVK